MLVYEAVLVVLTWRKTLNHYKSRHSLAPTPIMRLLRRDGRTFYAVARGCVDAAFVRDDILHVRRKHCSVLRVVSEMLMKVIS